LKEWNSEAALSSERHYAAAPMVCFDTDQVGLRCYPAVHSSRKGEELPMSEDALRGWFYTGVVVLALALWIAWYRVA
jgi:hypothetical protein